MKMSIFRRPLDLSLVALFVVMALLIFAMNEDPFARNWLCAKVPCPHLPHPLHKIIYDLAIASIDSLIFLG
jgi:hypothetical protein